jgi:PPOX class probable F420-dependent enzyme
MSDEKTSLQSPEVVEVLRKPGMAVFGTLLPDGSPHAVIAGVVVDGDQLVTHAGPGAQRLKNLDADPRINVLVVDPEDPRIYVEVRGVASLRECTSEDIGPLFKAQAEKYGLPAHVGQVAEGLKVVQVRITPKKVNFVGFRPMGPQTLQVKEEK